MMNEGLSPRVRGSRFRRQRSRRHAGSIPASAGQPQVTVVLAHRGEVYPRECGAAGGHVGLIHCARGLSPRVRGSHSRRSSDRIDQRSIPASAGQPSYDHSTSHWEWVYPRECGAARSVERLSASGSGLSPRVRGSRAGVGVAVGVGGSIPASAGQPKTPFPDRLP